jgi:hypothetical protein
MRVFMVGLQDRDPVAVDEPGELMLGNAEMFSDFRQRRERWQKRAAGRHGGLQIYAR